MDDFGHRVVRVLGCGGFDDFSFQWREVGESLPFNRRKGDFGLLLRGGKKESKKEGKKKS